MESQQQHILDEMRKLISKSCQSLDLETNPFQSFHKSLLKYYFDVADVTIDYERKSLFLWSSSNNNLSSDTTLYKLSDAVPLRIAYDTLEETLKGCLDHQVNSIRFYRSLLFHYNNVEQAVPRDAMTA